MSHQVNDGTQSQRVDISAVIGSITSDGQRVAKDLGALAQTEVKPIAKDAGIGGGMFGAAGYLGLNAMSLLFMAGGFGFACIFYKALGWTVLPSAALGFVCMAVLLLAIAGVLALLGKKSIDKVHKPEKTIQEAQRTIRTLKGSVKNGQSAVTERSLARSALAQDKKQVKDLERIDG